MVNAMARSAGYAGHRGSRWDCVLHRKRAEWRQAEHGEVVSGRLLEVTGWKGDMSKRARNVIFMLTNGWKPIIISSFQKLVGPSEQSLLLSNLGP
jgi:hypothetical protein